MNKMNFCVLLFYFFLNLWLSYDYRNKFKQTTKFLQLFGLSLANLLLSIANYQNFDLLLGLLFSLNFVISSTSLIFNILYKQKPELELETLVNQLPLDIYWQDLSGNFLGANDNFLHSIKLDRAYLIGKTKETLLREKNIKINANINDSNILKLGRKLVKESIALSKYNLDFHSIKTAFKIQGKVQGILSVNFMLNMQDLPLDTNCLIIEQGIAASVLRALLKDHSLSSDIVDNLNAAQEKLASKNYEFIFVNQKLCDISALNCQNNTNLITIIDELPDNINPEQNIKFLSKPITKSKLEEIIAR